MTEQQPPDNQNNTTNTSGGGGGGGGGRHTGESDSRVERPTGTGSGGIDPARY